jgi:hypothetical protein
MRLVEPVPRPLSGLGRAIGTWTGPSSGMSRRRYFEGSVYKETRPRQTKDGPVVETLWVATVEDERDPVRAIVAG